MELPLGVLGIYAGLVIWTALLVVGLRRHNYGPFLGFGLVLLLFLNVRYFIEGATGSIAFFIGIYDVLDNLGASNTDLPAALASCPDNACTVWGDRYQTHPSWGVAFYDRFANGPALRRNLLYGHIGFNTISFVLMHFQLLRPGTSGNANRHRMIGRVSFASLTLGTIAALWLAAEHGPVGEYGGYMSTFGFSFMSLCVYGCAIMAVLKIRNGNIAEHRKWSIRFAGSMWGAFWLFRVMLFVLGPVLRNYEAAALLICIWFSAPLGIVIAEVFRRRSVARAIGTDVASTSPATVPA